MKVNKYVYAFNCYYNHIFRCWKLMWLVGIQLLSLLLITNIKIINFLKSIYTLSKKN